MRTNPMIRAAGMALAGLALVTPTAFAQDATPMASSMATPMTGAGAAMDVPLVDAAGDAVGLATLTEGDDGVTIHVLIEGLTPGEHGWHLHEFGDCDGTTDEPFSSAGGHWNPTDMEHGAPDAASHHAGDFGNFEATADGKAEATITTMDFSLGDGPDSVFDEDGTAIIIHAGRDDLTTQPSGDSGARFACGVVAEPMMGAGTPMAGSMTGAMGTPMATPMGDMAGAEATPMG
jgi:Cu-Zn family superoxide dismutase